MLDKYECLKKLADRRQDEVIITTMSVARPWSELSDGPFDFASANSAMGHAADFAYGLAMAQPSRRVITLNGDGSMLMCLGTLVTIVQRPLQNYVLVITDNASYEVTGNQPVPAEGLFDFEAIARGAGLKHVYTVTEAADFDEKLSLLLLAPGPLVFVWKLARADEPPPFPPRPMKERAWILKNALL